MEKITSNILNFIYMPLVPMVLFSWYFVPSTYYSRGGGGGDDSLIWPIRGRVTGQGMAFGLSALNRVYNFMQTCPRQGLSLL